MQNQKEKNVVKTGSCSASGKILAHLIIMVLILSCFAYFIWQSYQDKRQLTTQIQLLQQKLSEQSTAINLAKIENVKSSFGLSEVQYLIRLADINLAISRNVSQAIQLLTMADQRLAVLIINDLSLVTVRQALADNIAALKMVPNVDLVGIILKINALSDQITKLPVQSFPTELTKAQSEPSKLESKPLTSQPPTFWQKFSTTSWQQLQKIIIVKRHEQPIVPILSEEQQIDLIQKMQLALNQAEWAVLHKESTIYQAALQKVTSLANNYFSSNPTAANDIIKAVKELQEIDITPKIPELTSSLQVIDRVMKSTSGNDKS